MQTHSTLTPEHEAELEAFLADGGTLAMLQKFPAPMTAFQSYQAFLERHDYLRSQ